MEKILLIQFKVLFVINQGYQPHLIARPLDPGQKFTLDQNSAMNGVLIKPIFNSVRMIMVNPVIIPMHFFQGIDQIFLNSMKE